ncbi:hypothetical protein K431DRAFT_226152 [Polychaeton citri CBS 116435]|uniref:PH domain-containing protein n=1 Tax=Polychaeton citri CBS 116435 TaxID=1314669 RepID=A0A9P4Q9C2_9PEZI|nr:hypothetical protein K431DRAFT_226152 [Polychaeton citri CBS 116435]
MHDDRDQSATKPRILKKRRPSVLTDPAGLEHPDLPTNTTTTTTTTTYSASPSESPKPVRPSLMGSMRRPPSMFGSLRSSTRSSYDTSDYPDEPLSATPSISLSQADGSADIFPLSTNVLHHGEVQTSSGLLRKRKEYVVVTDSALHRFKSQGKASEVFSSIKNPSHRHAQSPSVGSQSDLCSLAESGDRDGRLPLRQIVSVRSMDDGKSSFAIEMAHLDEDCSNNGSVMNLQFSNLGERDTWSQHLRHAVNEARLRDETYVSPANLEYVARIMERDGDYDPANCAVFKAVQRHSAKTTGRSSSEDLSKVSSVICFLAIGVHKIHIIQPQKLGSRMSTPSLTSNMSQPSYGILTLTSLKINSQDDSFELTFRQPLKQSRVLYLASSASHEVGARIQFAEMFLRPNRATASYRFQAPKAVEAMLSEPVASDVEEHHCLDRTLSAYCVGYGVSPANIRYSIDYDCEDAPRFGLLPPPDTRRQDYSSLELLAVLRALRFNDSFGSISFSGVSLDSLNGLHDYHGREHSSPHTKLLSHSKSVGSDAVKPSLLVQEIRGLASGSKRLRRLDFSNCISSGGTGAVTPILEDDTAKSTDPGCDIVEAIFPLCKQQKTNVDWICLNGIGLSDTDLDYLVSAAADRSSHFRAIELNRCGLTDRTLGLILDALRAQESTLEALKIAGNPARLNPVTFDTQLSMFGLIRKLDLSWTNRNSGQEPFFTAETLLMWRLQELRLSGTALNEATIDAMAVYLAHPQSQALRELTVDQTYVTGNDIATLLQSMTIEQGQGRDLHFDISQARLSKDVERVSQAIASGFAPTHLTMRAIEYREESMFRKVLIALTGNKTIQYLDMSQTALPGDAGDDTCKALERLLAENDTLLAFDLSGDDSRLATSKIGPGINEALAGLKRNKAMRRFHVEKQKLGLQGSSTLADVLKVNNTLQELYCDNNEVPLQGLTDLVNSLVDNTSVIYLPAMHDGRAAAFKTAEAAMKAMTSCTPTQSRTSYQNPSAGVQRRLTNARRNVAKAASAYTPSFTTLSSASRTGSPLTGPKSPPPGSASAPPQALKLRKGSQTSTTGITTTFTVQDIQNTHRLLSEQWDRQCERLEQYLNRNWFLLNDIPVETAPVGEDEVDRPDSVGSISKMLQQVKYDTTPRAEKPLYFDSATLDAGGTGCSTSGSDADSDPPTTPEERRPSLLKEKGSAISFKQFLIGSDSKSLHELEDEDAQSGLGHLTIATHSVYDEEDPNTPTRTHAEAI